MALGGWQEGGGGAVGDRYGAGFAVERLLEAIASVRYEHVDLSHLVRQSCVTVG